MTIIRYLRNLAIEFDGSYNVVLVMKKRFHNTGLLTAKNKAKTTLE